MSNEPFEGLAFGNITVLPVVHYRMEFAHLVRRWLEANRPQAVALELPETLAAPVERAVRRLPEASVVLYQDSGGNPVYLPVVPADPLFEAARWALDNGAELRLVDLDSDYPHRHRDSLPDSHAALKIGFGRYVAECMRVFDPAVRQEEDRRRERAMAFHMQQLASSGRSAALVCGMAHARAVLAELDVRQARPLGRLRRENVHVLNLHPECLSEVMDEAPYLHALYEMRRQGLPPEPELLPPPRRRFSARDAAMTVLAGGKSGQEDPDRAKRPAIEWIARRCGAEAVEGEGWAAESDAATGTASASPRQPAPSLARRPPNAARAPVDRRMAVFLLLEQSARLYHDNTGEELHRWQKRNFSIFSRNYALLGGRLVPDFFETIAAARACVDDNFAWEVMDLGSFMPWQRETAEIPTVRVKGEEIWFGLRRLRVRRRLPRRKRALMLPVRGRRKETRPGEWLESFDGDGLCSYPPEDVVVERFGTFLRSKGVSILSTENSSVRPFTTSMLDGLDLRETIRNWVKEHRVYVREERRVPGGVGAVVVIFDEDSGGGDYPYHMTWLGEHSQESDMAFYATPLESQIVGPGISRCEYGGFLMTYPPRRMRDVWNDPDYENAQSKPEVLLLAGLDYSQERNIVYLAKKPPRSILKSVAARMGRHIVYLPIGTLSPVTVKKMRVFHVLSGHDKRDVAKDYVW